MQIKLTTSFQKLSTLLGVDSITSFKVQVVSGKVLAVESEEDPEPSSSIGNQFTQGEYFTSTSSGGALYVRGTTPSTTISAIQAINNDFTLGISPFNGATGSSGGGGGGSSSGITEAQARTISVEESEKRVIKQINHTLDGQELTTTISNEQDGVVSVVSTASVTLPQPDNSDVTIDKVTEIAKNEGDRAITHSDQQKINAIKHVVNGQQLTTAISNQDGVVSETSVTLPNSGGGGGVVIDLPNDTIPMVENNELVDSGLRAIDGSIETAPNSVKIGYQKYSSGGVSSFIYDNISRTYYRILRQNAENQNLLFVKTQGSIKQYQTTQNFNQEIVFPNNNVNNVALPTEDLAQYIYIPANSETIGFFEIALARSVTSNLIFELDILGDVILKRDLGIPEEGLIRIDSPPLDLDLSSDIGINVYQEDDEPVYLGGENGTVYLNFKYQAFNFEKISNSGTGGGETIESNKLTLSEKGDSLSSLITTSLGEYESQVSLDFVDAATLATTQQATLDLANAYTNNKVKEISGGGGVTSNSIVGEIISLADKSLVNSNLLYCDGSFYKKSDYPVLYDAIGDAYQQKTTPSDSFQIPKIDDIVSTINEQDLTLDSEIVKYLNARNSATQHTAVFKDSDKAYFVYGTGNRSTQLLTVNKDNTFSGVDISYEQPADVYAVTKTDDAINILAFNGNKIYHSVVIDNEVKHSMVDTGQGDLINPVHCAIIHETKVLIVLDKVTSIGNRYSLRSFTYELNNSDGTAVITDAYSISVSIVNPRNLIYVGNTLTSLAGLMIAGQNGMHCYNIAPSFGTLDSESEFITGIKLTGADQFAPITIEGKSSQRFWASDEANLYYVHMGDDLDNKHDVKIEFVKSLVEHKSSLNLMQPMVFFGDDDYKKLRCDDQTSTITISSSKIIDVPVKVENTSHYIVSKIENHGGAGGGVETVDLRFVEDTKTLFCKVNNIEDGQELKFSTEQELSDATKEAITTAQNYTDEKIRNLPDSGGDTKFGVTDVPVGTVTTFNYETSDPCYLKCDGSTVQTQDYPLLYDAIGHSFSDISRPESAFDLPKIPDEVVAESVSTIDLDKAVYIFDVIDSDLQDSSVIGTDIEVVSAFSTAEDVNICFVDTRNFQPYVRKIQSQEQDPFLFFAVTSSIENAQMVFHVIGISKSLSTVRHWAYFEETILAMDDFTIEGLTGSKIQLELHQEVGLNSSDYTLIAATDQKVISYKLNIDISGESSAEKISEESLDNVLSLSVTSKFPLTGAVYAIASKQDYGSCVYQIQNHSLIKKENLNLQVLGVDPVPYEPTSFRAITESVFVDLSESDSGLVVKDGGGIPENQTVRQPNMSFINLKDTTRAIKLSYGNDNKLYGSTYEDIQIERYEVKNLSYIKAKPDYEHSSIVESVESDVSDNGELTISVNGVSATTQLPTGATISEKTMPVVNINDVGNPVFEGSKIAIAAAFATLSYEDSVQFRLKMFFSQGNTLSDFLPSNNGGALLFDKYKYGDNQLQECYWNFTDREGDSWLAYMHGTSFKDFKRITKESDEDLVLRINELETEISTLKSELQSIRDLAFNNFELYSPEQNTMQLIMKRINVESQDVEHTLLLDGQTPNPEDPDANIDVFNVYHGWTQSSIENITAEHVVDTSDPEHNVTNYIFGSRYPNQDSPPDGYQFILDAVFNGEREFSEDPSSGRYLYIAFPINQVEPEIKSVLMGGQLYSFESVNIVINEMNYRVLVSGSLNLAPVYTMKLSNGG